MPRRLSNIWTLLATVIICSALFMPAADRSLRDSQENRQPSVQELSGAYVQQDTTTRNRKPVTGHTHYIESRSARQSTAKLTPELISQSLEVAHQLDPTLGERMSKLCEQDSAQFELVLQTSGRRLLAMVQLRERDPQLYKAKVSEMSLELQIQNKAVELKQAMRTNDPAEVDNHKSQLEQLLQLQLAMSIRARVEYMNRLEEHIEAVRKDIEHEGRHFKETIQARLNSLIENGPTDATTILPASADIIENEND